MMTPRTTPRRTALVDQEHKALGVLIRKRRLDIYHFQLRYTSEVAALAVMDRLAAEPGVRTDSWKSAPPYWTVDVRITGPETEAEEQGGQR